MSKMFLSAALNNRQMKNQIIIEERRPNHPTMIPLWTFPRVDISPYHITLL